jgi:hypothetical protein
MDEQRYQLDLRFADREPQRLFCERSGGSWRSESENSTASASGEPLRIELSEDDGFDLEEATWSGNVQDVVGAFVAVSDELDSKNVTVNGEEWQWMSAQDGETLVILTPSVETTERVANVRWYSEGGMTSSTAWCRLMRYGRWVLEWSWNDDGLPKGIAIRQSALLQPSDVADWLAHCDLAPGRSDDLEWEALSLTIDLAQDETVLEAVLDTLPKVAMPGWSINGTRYVWDAEGQRWRISH